jgi:hypothetical protein
VHHLRRWKPYVGRFGLLVLELHTLPPALTAATLERTPAVAYDATHGFSDQYLVELPVFAGCAWGRAAIRGPMAGEVPALGARGGQLELLHGRVS